MLPTRDTLASLTSGSNYSDDDEIVAVDDDEDEIVAVDDEDEEPGQGRAGYNREREEDEEVPEGEGLDEDMRAPSRGGIMLRPDSRMTNATVVRPSFTEGRTISRASHAMSAFGGLRDHDSLDRTRSLSPPTVPPSQRSSVAHPVRSSTLMTDVIPSTPTSDASFASTNQRRSPPLNVRRSQVIAPLTLQTPPSFASTIAALRSAPPPASTDFFDTVYTHSLAHGVLGFDSDSEEAEPPMPIYVQPRSRAVSTSASGSRPRPLLPGRSTTDSTSGSTVMHFPSTTNPYLATDPNPYQSLDPRKPVTNTPPATQTRFRGLGQMLRPATSMGLRSSGRKSPHLIQHPAVRAAASNIGSFPGHDGSSHGHGGSSHGHGASSHGHESVRSGAASIRSERSLGGRAARSEESMTSVRRQDPSLLRLDGMYAKHVQAEKDRLKQISAASRRT